jgi:hypothetical protein
MRASRRWTQAELDQRMGAMGFPRATPAANHQNWKEREASKYGNEKTRGYASRKEADRAQELRLMQRGGAISHLEEQVRFVLIPAQREPDGKLVERQLSYIADFVYRAASGIVVEDVKGMRTRAYIIKRKLMLHVHGIRVRES